MFKKLTCLLVCSLILGCSKKDNKVLVVGTSADNPPFSFIKLVKGTTFIKGLDVDILKATMGKIGWQYNLVNKDFDALIPLLKNKKLDLIVSAVTPTDERRKVVDFSTSYYKSRIVMLVRSFDDVKLWGPKWFNKKLAAQTGSTHLEFLQSMKKEKARHFAVQSLTVIMDMVENLKNNRVNGVVLSKAVADKLVSISADKLRIYEFEDAPSINFAFVMRKGSPLKKEIDEALLNLEVSEKLKGIIDKWTS